MGKGPKRVVSSGSVGIRSGHVAPGTALSLLEPHETGLQRASQKDLDVLEGNGRKVLNGSQSMGRSCQER